MANNVYEFKVAFPGFITILGDRARSGEVREAFSLLANESYALPRPMIKSVAEMRALEVEVQSVLEPFGAATDNNQMPDVYSRPAQNDALAPRATPCVCPRHHGAPGALVRRGAGPFQGRHRG